MVAERGAGVTEHGKTGAAVTRIAVGNRKRRCFRVGVVSHIRIRLFFAQFNSHT